MATIGEPRSAPAISWIDLGRWLQPGTLAGALLALLLLTISPAPEHVQRTIPSAAAAKLAAIPLAARPLVSSTLGRDQPSFGIHRGESGLTAANGAGLSARFGQDGVQVRAGRGTLALHLRAAGYGRSLRRVEAAAPTEHANRVTYRHAALSEWYTNGPLGLEQGFTVKAPLAGAKTGQLTLALSLSGSLRPMLERGGRSLSFGGSSLRYTGLTASDARGHRLSARLELRGQTLLIRVNDRGAHYPLTVDPFLQLAKLTASDGAAYNWLGGSVAISGDTIVAGAPGGGVSGTTHGSVYVFVKPAGGWANATQTAKLTASDGADGDHLGSSVAISGDTIVAGASFAGAAYVFVRPAGGWTSGTETAKLTPSKAGGFFGSSIGISGDTIVVGAPLADALGRDSPGAAYVFVKPAGGWTSGTQTAKLAASDGATDDEFGVSVAISGDTIVAGAYRATVSGRELQGAAYVFVKPAGAWANATQTAKLTAAQGAAHAELGVSVAISGDTIVAGAPALPQNEGEGVAYVFVEPSGGWTDVTEAATLTPSDGTVDDYFGVSAAIVGDTIVVGDQAATVSRVYAQGAAYVFGKPPGGWANATQTAKLTASDGAYYAQFGDAVDMSGDAIVVGAWYADGARGAAYVYRPAPVITATKHLIPASDPGRFDLKVGGTVVELGAGDGGSGSKEVLPGTYRVSESATAGTSLSGYATSIACSLNGNPGPSASGTTQLTVTVTPGDQLACTITNKRKAQVTLTKHLVPASDPGRFDLKVGSAVVKAAAGDGDSGSALIRAGAYTLSEVGAAGTNLANYARSIACTRNGAAGPSASGTSLKVTVDWGDVLSCTITNQPGATITLTKDLRPSTDPGRFDLKVAGTVVKASAGNGGSGSLAVPAGTYRVAETAAAGTSLSDYATSIACSLNGNPGPAASGTTQLNVTVAVGDQVACTITNKRKA